MFDLQDPVEAALDSFRGQDVGPSEATRESARRTLIEQFGSPASGPRTLGSQRLSRRTLVVAVVAIGTLVCSGIGVAAVKYQSGRDSATAPEARQALSSAADLPALQRPAEFTADELAAKKVLEAGLVNHDLSEGAAGRVVLSSARPFSLPDNEGFAWVARTSEDEICLFSPRLGGEELTYSGACNSLDQFNQGGIVGVSPGGGDGRYIGYAVQPEGVRSVIGEADGSKRDAVATDGVVIASLGAGESFSSGGLALATDDLAP